MKRFLVVLFCIAALHSAAQSKKQKFIAYNRSGNKNNQFLQKQWWIGLKAGTNLSRAVVERSYTILVPTNYDTDAIRKKYDNYKLAGMQVGLEATFYFRGFSISLQPTYQHVRFGYANQLEWADGEASSTQHLTLTFQQEQKIEYAVIPLLVKYEFGGRKIRPYIQAGGYGAYLINANKSVETYGVDFASGGARSFKNEPIVVGAKDLFAKNHYGVAGGAGVYYNLGNIRLNLDIQYKHGLTNISAVKNRYDNDRLSGIGDAMDDLTLNNIAISIGALFPLRFLSSGFKSHDTTK